MIIMRSKRFKEAMKAEAIKRMKRLGISNEVITIFESENKLWVCKLSCVLISTFLCLSMY